MTYQEMEQFADAMLPHYLHCATWADSEVGDEHDRPFSEEAKAIARLDCLWFVRNAYPYLGDVTPEQAGHNLWLSRNGHGTGFWDRDFRYKDILHSYAQKCMGCDLELSDAGEWEFL